MTAEVAMTARIRGGWVAWELHIKGIGNGDPVLDDGPPLGGIDDVRSTIEAYFPDVDWETIGRGFCYDDNGVMEFKFVGEPVEVLWLRVQGCDCTDSLIAMAREKHWVVVDDSSGEDLESDCDIEEDLVRTLQRAAEQRKNAKKPVTRSSVKMPKIVSQVPLTQIDPSQISNCVIVPLYDDEVTDDVFYEYSAGIDKDELRFRSLRGIASCRYEVLLPNGQRLAVLLKCGPTRNNADMSLFKTFFESMSRPIATIHDGIVETADGTHFDVRECFWIERALGRRRRVSGLE